MSGGGGTRTRSASCANGAAAPSGRTTTGAARSPACWAACSGAAAGAGSAHDRPAPQRVVEPADAVPAVAVRVEGDAVRAAAVGPALLVVADAGEAFAAVELQPQRD